MLTLWFDQKQGSRYEREGWTHFFHEVLSKVPGQLKALDRWEALVLCKALVLSSALVMSSLLRYTNAAAYFQVYKVFYDLTCMVTFTEIFSCIDSYVFRV